MLPGYMVPARQVHVDALPLTGNGKLDRAALLAVVSRTAGDPPAPGVPEPLPGPGGGAWSGEATDPSTVEVRQALAGIWHDLLGAGDLSPDSDFFTLGGTSIKVLHMTAAVHRRFGVDLRVATVFRRPTFAEVAAGEIRNAPSGTSTGRNMIR
jgi:aryl carrier-like protein